MYITILYIYCIKTISQNSNHLMVMKMKEMKEMMKRYDDDERNER